MTSFSTSSSSTLTYSTIVPSNTKVDVLVTLSANDYAEELESIVSKVAEKNFRYTFDNINNFCNAMQTTNHPKRMVVIFCRSERDYDFQDRYRSLLNTCAAAVGYQGHIIFGVLTRSSNITPERITGLLYNNSTPHPISEDYQKRITIKTYLPTGFLPEGCSLAENEADRMKNELKVILDQMG